MFKTQGHRHNLEVQNTNRPEVMTHQQSNNEIIIKGVMLVCKEGDEGVNKITEDY